MSLITSAGSSARKLCASASSTSRSAIIHPPDQYLLDQARLARSGLVGAGPGPTAAGRSPRDAQAPAGPAPPGWWSGAGRPADPLARPPGAGPAQRRRPPCWLVRHHPARRWVLRAVL